MPLEQELIRQDDSYCLTVVGLKGLGQVPHASLRA